MKKIPQVTAAEIAYFCRAVIEESEFSALPVQEQELFTALAYAAMQYCANQTGLEVSNEPATDNADLAYAVKTVAAEMYDNRQMTAQYSVQNPTVTAILGGHSVNLLPGVGADA